MLARCAMLCLVFLAEDRLHSMPHLSTEGPSFPLSVMGHAAMPLSLPSSRSGTAPGGDFACLAGNWHSLLNLCTCSGCKLAARGEELGNHVEVLSDMRGLRVSKSANHEATYSKACSSANLEPMCFNCPQWCLSRGT